MRPNPYPERSPENCEWGAAFRLMDEQIQIIGSNWFTTAQGQEMADMVGSGTIDLSYLEHRRFPLECVNEAISGLKDRDGGFSNYVVLP